MAYVDQLLGAGEAQVFVAHQHVLFVLGRIAGRVLLALLLIAAGIAGKVIVTNRAGQIANATTTVSATTLGNAVIFVALLLALIPLVQAFWRTLQWRNEQFIVTNRRVIRVQGVLGKRTVDSSLNMINDLLTNQSFAGRLAGYGDVRIVTGNDIADESYQGIADPLAFKRALLGARDAFLRELSGGGSGGPRATLPAEADPAAIPNLIAQLADLRARGAISQHEYDTKRAELLRRL